eukprot:TRINITY_DN4568_c0_g1_i2.p1 TRINITY_DN4568_c0_g1~~TRINITY_DN4568_c0_g1_i2.p1  ORF type:complete len:572 (+),score=69.05 TRINITY_DN4568_c0_g1_i2:70-1785(+)
MLVRFLVIISSWLAPRWIGVRIEEKGGDGCFNHDIELGLMPETLDYETFKASCVDETANFEKCVGFFKYEFGLFIFPSQESEAPSEKACRDFNAKELDRTKGALFALFDLFTKACRPAQQSCKDDVSASKQWPFLSDVASKLCREGQEVHRDAMIALTVLHDVMKIRHVGSAETECAKGQDAAKLETLAGCHYWPTDPAPLDHDDALRVMIEKTSTQGESCLLKLSPVLSMLKNKHGDEMWSTIRALMAFTQSFNYGQLVQGEAPPRVAFSEQMKKQAKLIDMNPVELFDFYMLHFATDVAGAPFETGKEQECISIVSKSNITKKVLPPYQNLRKTFSTGLDLSTYINMLKEASKGVLTESKASNQTDKFVELRLAAMAQQDHATAYVTMEVWHGLQNRKSEWSTLLGQNSESVVKYFPQWLRECCKPSSYTVFSTAGNQQAEALQQGAEASANSSVVRANIEERCKDRLDTGGTCWTKACDEFRGETVCTRKRDGRKCVCKAGSCSDGGKCVDTAMYLMAAHYCNAMFEHFLDGKNLAGKIVDFADPGRSVQATGAVQKKEELMQKCQSR